ncbi:hypothetical protein acsn021_29890 [Anaerocolumna cellulosilytica]|uniref:Uncharacterized protein n=1 Tax=Anaerocolumna cellulosilytica TaxID=433286 RepID=A0A6S6R7H8_9FIRM|nr:hypothetical protein acsn021_29890 [Anaerocolumna cellulosilytica]
MKKVEIGNLNRKKIKRLIITPKGVTEQLDEWIGELGQYSKHQTQKRRADK